MSHLVSDDPVFLSFVSEQLRGCEDNEVLLYVSGGKQISHYSENYFSLSVLSSKTFFVLKKRADFGLIPVVLD